MRRQLLRASLLVVCLSMLSTKVMATEYCAGSSAEINDAIAQANAAPDGTDHDIRVQRGYYEFILLWQYGVNVRDQNFSLSGGWDAECSTQTINPANTVLRGFGEPTDIRFMGQQRSIRLEGLRFEAFGNFVLGLDECALSCAQPRTLILRHNHIRLGRIVSVYASGADSLQVTNNLIESLLGPRFTAHGTVSISHRDSVVPAQVAFNTIAVSCRSQSPSLALYSQAAQSLYSHNIVVPTEVGCLPDPIGVRDADGGQPWRFLHNLHSAEVDGLQPAANSLGNLINPDPKFVSNTDYHLRDDSPAIEAGQTLEKAIDSGLLIPAHDLDGPAHVRLLGERFDIGAFEFSGELFSDSFE